MIKVKGSDILFAETPFLAVHKDSVERRDWSDGMLGLSPKDDSSGPLFINYLFG